MSKIIQRDRSVIPACDVSFEKFEEIIKETADIDGVGAYKIGFSLSLRYGLPKVVEIARKYTDKPLIYDHQKAGTDIPATGNEFAKIMKESRINAVILFPMAGPTTQKKWTRALQEENIEVIIGGLMTHDKYLYSEGGVIADEGISKDCGWLWMYRNGVDDMVNNYVVPGNKPYRIKKIREELEVHQRRIGIKLDELVFYAPGFVAQGGEISETAETAGKYWHAIIGRGIYKADNIKQAALELTSKL